MKFEKISKFVLSFLNGLFFKKNYERGFYYGNTLKDEKDKRDLMYVGSSESSMPKKYTIPNLPPIRNQGRLNSCASFAVMACVEIQMPKRRFIDTSERFHYYNARKHVNNQYPKNVGMTLRDACKTIINYGVGFEMLCPYNSKDYNTKPSDLAYAFSKLYPIKNYEAVYNIRDIKYCLLENKGVAIGIYIDEDLIKLNRSFYTFNPIKPGKLGGHGVTIVGYDDDDEVFIIRNSWGRYWGDKGYFRMPYEIVRKQSFSWWRILLK